MRAIAEAAGLIEVEYEALPPHAAVSTATAAIAGSSPARSKRRLPP